MAQNNPLDQIKADCNVVRKQLKSLLSRDVTVNEVVEQLANNVVPLIAALADEVAEVDDIVQEVVEREESYLHPDIAEQLIGTLALGQALVQFLREKILPGMDDLARKRVEEVCTAFEKSAEVSALTITSIVDESGDDDDGDDSDKDDSDEDDSDEDDSDDQIDTTPIAKENDDADDAEHRNDDSENGPAAS